MSGDATDVQRALVPLCALLADYSLLVAEEPTSHDLIPRADSPAMAELSEERRFATPGWEEPVRNAHSYGQVLVTSLADHLAAFAAIAQHAVVGPSFSQLTLLRAIMEISTLSSWLLERDIGTERRIKRSLAYRIDNAASVERLATSAARAQSRATRKRARDVVDRLGWTFANRAVGGEDLPHAKRDFSRYVFPPGNRDSFDHVMWNFASAGAHGAFYALAQPLREPPGYEPDPLDPRGVIRAVVVSARDIATYGAIAYFATKAAADARRHLMGWPESEAFEVGHRKGAELAKIVAASLHDLDAVRKNERQR